MFDYKLLNVLLTPIDYIQTYIYVDDEEQEDVAASGGGADDDDNYEAAMMTERLMKMMMKLFAVFFLCFCKLEPFI